MDRISGSYPGGPRRQDGSEPRERADLERVEEFEERRSRASLQRKRERRVRRLRIGFLVALLTSAGIGLTLGLMSHRTSEELVQEREQDRTRDFDPSQEVNRMLLELWKMEDMERAPGTSR